MTRILGRSFGLGVVAVSLLAGACGTSNDVPTEDSARVSSGLTFEERADRIRAYFKERQARLQVVATTETRSGQILDWIKRESQVEGGELSEPPLDKDDEVPDTRRILRRNAKVPPGVDEGARTEVQMNPELRGPDGTVPIVRFDVEEYLRSVRELPENPMDVLTKVPPPSPASNDRYYGVWQRYGTFYGSSGRINIWNVSGPTSNETSIAQVAVIRGTPMQAIEAGKIEYPGINSNRPYFFVYYRTDGASSGDWVGGYDTTVDGWVQYSSSVAPRMSLAGWESSLGGNQYSLDVEVRLWQGNWWVRAAGEWAGYYPYCKGGQWYGPCPSGTLFSASGIRDQASRLDWYGEIFDSTAPKPTSTDMGSGRFASEAWSHAAYFRNLTYYWAPSTYWWWDSGSPSATDSGCYSVSSALYSNDPNWRNWYYFGGPGKESTNCK